MLVVKTHDSCCRASRTAGTGVAMASLFIGKLSTVVVAVTVEVEVTVEVHGVTVTATNDEQSASLEELAATFEFISQYLVEFRSFCSCAYTAKTVVSVASCSSKEVLIWKGSNRHGGHCGCDKKFLHHGWNSSVDCGEDARQRG